MFPRLLSFDTPEFLRGVFPDQIILHSYGFMIALGVLAAFLFTRKKVVKYGVNADQLSTLFIWAILAGFVGGRIFYYLEDIDKYIADPAKMLRISGGGFVFYGSVIFVIPTIIIWLRKHKIAVRPFLDIMAFVGPIVQCFGRVGCFLAGCCHGKVCNNALGVTFTNEHSMAHPLNVPLYPTQLFDIAINLIILVTLYLVGKRQHFAGKLMLIYLMMYGVGRSINEMFRGDEERGFVFNGLMSHSQLIALILIMLSTYFWFRWKNRPEDQL